MDTHDDKIQKLEEKIAFMQDCHREQIRHLVRWIGDLEEQVKQLSGALPDLAAVEKIALDAYTLSNEDVQDSLVDVHRVVPLDLPHQVFFNQLPTIREARGLARRRSP
jgi:hypothetical protein